MKHLDGEWAPQSDILSPEGAVLVRKKHSTLNELLNHDVVSRSEIGDLHVFTTIRNPFDSLVSLWHKQAHAYQPLLDDPTSFIHRKPDFKSAVEFARDHSFSDWVEYRFSHAVNDPPRHLYAAYIKGCDSILRFESLQSDFDDLLLRIGVTRAGHTIPQFNETEGRDPNYRRYYDVAARELVTRVFGKDLSRFGYRF